MFVLYKSITFKQSIDNGALHAALHPVLLANIESKKESYPKLFTGVQEKPIH